MKTSKRFLALVLSALMIFSVVIIPGADLSLFGFEADAAESITIGGITQQRVVSNYESTYAGYQSKFFGGSNTNWPTNFVIPGLGKKPNTDNEYDDYTPQGMTYWEEKEWILISAYDASGAGKHSVIYAIDAVSTEFVALFKVVNQNGTVNTSHGGGIAASEYNFYYADNASKISYVPLSEMDVPKGTVTEIKLVDSIDCSGELNGAASSYCCYEDGVLWVGNFHWMEEDYNRYETPAHPNYYSMLLGYKLHGNSSAEEWYYLSTNRAENKVKVNNTNSQTSGATTFTSTVNANNKITINGSVKTDSALGEAIANFGYLYLVEGQEYVIEFTADNNLSDMYMFAPNGTHCNVKQSQNSKITKLSDGRYHYTMTFTAGLKPNGADSSWPTTQSTNESYTGKYTIRFDQDSVPAGGRTFAITDFSVTKKYTAPEFTVTPGLEGVSCEGNPTYCIAFENTNTSNDGGTNANIDRIQYAMVSKGKVYISRSWSRNESGNHTRELAIADLDINSPGNVTATINGRSRDVHYVTNASLTHFGGDYKDANKNLDQMLFMGEALCVINDYLYMFSEGAAWTYNGKNSSSICDEPIDVIWKIDQHALTGTPRPAENVKSIYYEKVDKTTEIVSGEEYLVVFESKEKDPVTQQNILYALDSFGGYDNSKLSKKTNKTSVTAKSTLDAIGIIGYPITEYSTGTVEGNDVIYLNETDDSRKSIRWTITNDSNKYYFQNADYYYGNNRYLCVNGNCFAMTSDPEIFGINDDNGGFKIENGTYRLWCNAGYTQNHLDLYTNAYKNHYQTDFVPIYNNLEEVKGTFHSNTSEAVIDSEYGKISLYKKVKDPYASTLETDVYTDLNAELQPDGTYTVNLETYATAAVQYMNLDHSRPTDFIFVVDNSVAMSGNSDCMGFREWNYPSNGNTIGFGSFGWDKDDIGTDQSYPKYKTHNIYYLGNAGSYYPITLAVNYKNKKSNQFYWLYYHNTDNGYYYVLNSNGTVDDKAYTNAEITAMVNNNENATASSDKSTATNRAKTTLFYGTHYSYENVSRINALKQTLNKLTYTIATDNSNHRISLITFESSNNAISYMISDSNAVTTSNTVAGTDFKKVFFNNNQFDVLRSQINNLSTTGTTPQPSIGLGRAANTFSSCGQDYTATGDRSACILFFTCAQDMTDNKVNDSILRSRECKQYGAFVYTIKVGTVSDSSNNVGNFFEYTSSNYINAENVANPGERNRNSDIDYSLDSLTSSLNAASITSNYVAQANKTSSRAFAKINENSIITGEISQYFNADNATFSYKTIDAAYDGLDRLYFKEDTLTDVNGITASLSTDKHSVEVKGFNFSKHYVATSNIDTEAKAKKLVVSISGLTLEPSAISNERVSVDAETALYLNKSYYDDDNARKRYPTDYLNVPEYTYVLDYGIGMLDTDVNGTLCSIDDQPRKQSTYKTALTDSDDVKNSVIIKTVNGNQDLVYGLKPDTATGNNSGYCLIKRPDETYDWFKINVVPASNVYFEENSASQTTSNSSYANWIWDNENESDFYQQLTSTNDIYGFDESYKNEGSAFSHGTAYKTSVNDSTMRSQTLSFAYTGNAIDLYGSCGENTGIYIITIKNASGGIEKVYITDTYLSDSSLYTDGEKINQVPILHHENADFGKYTVEVTSAFLSSMVGQRNPVRTFGLRDTDEGVDFYSADFEDEVIEAILSFAEMEELMGENIEVSFCDENSVLNGGEGADVATTFGFFSTNTDLETDREFTELTNYFDGFRVYQPAGLGTGDGMYPESEQGALYYNVVDNLLTEEQIDTIGKNGVAYIEKVEDTDYNFGTYEGNGPKHELYLKPKQAISFTVAATSPNAKAMVSLRTVKGNATATINGQQFNVSNTSELYYRINSLTFDDSGNAIVTIQNTGNTILVVDTIKLCNGLNMGVMMMSAMPRIRMMMAAPAVETDPNEPETEEIPDIPTPEAPPVVEMPEGPSTTPEGDTGTEEEKDFIEQITENFTKLLNMIKSMLDTIVNLLKSIMA